MMSVVKGRHRAIVPYPCLFLKGCREVWEMGLAYFWHCKAIKQQDALGADTWASLYWAYLTFCLCIVLWNNWFLETT